MKKGKKTINCPTCGTPCTIEGMGDFNSKDKAITLHYEPVARKEERERVFDVLMSCMPETAENISTIMPEDARKMLQDFVKKYWK